MKIIVSTMKIWAMAVFAVLLAYGCGDDAANSAIDNSVYFANVTNVNITRVTVDDGGSTFPVQLRMAKPARTATNVTIGVDSDVLSTYNEAYGTAYVLLPAEFYDFSNTTTVIEAGSSIASAISLNLQPLSMDLAKTGLTYALPIAIKSVTGGSSVLNGSEYFIYVITPKPIADVVLLGSGGNGLFMTINNGPISVTNYTIEFLIKVDGSLAQGNANQAVFNATNGTNDNDLIFTRFAAGAGDDASARKFSIKPFGGTEHATKTLFENYKWYHIACVYNSNAGTISLYVNGVLDNKEDCESGHAFSLNTATGPDGQNGSVGNWAQNRGFRFVGQADTENGFKSPVEAAEVRFWSVIRSEVQIKENMYGIDPATPGLVGYWKCNEGNGTDIHDISGNGHNAIIGTLRYGPTTRPDALNWNLNQSVEVGK